MDKHIGFQIKRLSKLIKKRVDGDLGGEGLELTGMQRWLIHYLYINPHEELFQKDVEKRFGMGRSSATELLKSLEEAGMITRTPVSRDARLKKIELTEVAIKQQKRIESAIGSVENKLVDGFAPDEEKALRLMLDRCIRNMESQGETCDFIDTGTENFAKMQGDTKC